MKDYCAVLKIQQGRLRELMREQDLSGSDLAKLAGVSPSQVGYYLNFRKTPKRENGRWRKAVVAICDALNVLPEDVFPDHLNHVVPNNEIEQYLDSTQLAGHADALCLGPAHGIECEERDAVINELLEELPEKERWAIDQHFLRGRTLYEIADEYGCSAEYIRSLEFQGLKRLRHPAKIKLLKEVR